MKTAKRLLALLALALASSATLADPVIDDAMPSSVAAQTDSFVVPLPEFSAHQLLDRLHQHRATLQKQREGQRKVAERCRMTVGKTVLAIVAPGGLLIAAGMQTTKAHAEQQVAALDTRIDQVTTDLHAVQRIAARQSFMLAVNSPFED